MERSKADSFTAFLEAKLRSKARRGAASSGTPLALLTNLAEAPGNKMLVRDLQAASGMSFTDFAEAIKELKESGYLNLSGPPASEVATLTSLGADVAGLARPR